MLLLSVVFVLVQSQRPLVTESEVAEGIAALALVERQEVVVRPSDWASCEEGGRRLGHEVREYLENVRAGEASSPVRALTADERRWFERCRGLLIDVHEAAVAGQWLAEVDVSPHVVVVLVFLSEQLPVEQMLGLLLDAAGPAYYFWPMLWDLWAVLLSSVEAPMPALEQRIVLLAEAAAEDDTPLETAQMFRELSHALPEFQQCGVTTSHPDEWLALMMEGLESPARSPSGPQRFFAKHFGGRFRRPCVAHMADDTVAYVRQSQRDARRQRPLAFQDAHALLLLRRRSCGREELSTELNGVRTDYLVERRSAETAILLRASEQGGTFEWRRSVARCLVDDEEPEVSSP